MSYEKPAPDGQFRLRPCCNCKSDDVVYNRASSGGSVKWMVKCLGCGLRTPWFGGKHTAQVDWNERYGDAGK